MYQPVIVSSWRVVVEEKPTALKICDIEIGCAAIYEDD